MPFGAVVCVGLHLAGCSISSPRGGAAHLSNELITWLRQHRSAALLLLNPHAVITQAMHPEAATELGRRPAHALTAVAAAAQALQAHAGTCRTS